MNLLSDIITYVRRIIKSPSNAVITDALIIDYINRFWIMDVDARIQLFDLKTKYQFQTAPGFDQYNMPLYGVQTEPGPQTISYYPVYQGFMSPAYVNGVQVPIQTDRNTFFNIWPNIVQQMTTVAVGNGGSNYTFTFPIAPNNTVPTTTPYQYILRGHVDTNGVVALAQSLSSVNPIIDPPVVTATQALTTIPATPVANAFASVFITTNLADGTNVVVTDSGQFLSGNQNYGLLMTPGAASNGNQVLTGGYTTALNTINYFTGQVNVTFPVNIPAGMNINAQCFQFQTGLPRGILFWDNTLVLRSPPDQQYLVELDAYLSPAGFLATNQAITFAYMAEYLARGAARKILADTGDVEQFQFYEPLFIEQEQLVWKRSQRQFTATRTQTIYSQGVNQGQSGFNNLGGSTL
jgi:hypothetical protein